VHRPQARPGIGRTDHYTGVQSHGSDLVRVAQRHQSRHRGTRRQPGKVDLTDPYIGPGCQFVDQQCQRLCFAPALSGREVEPLPAPMHGAPQRLLRISHHESFALGQRVHARASRQGFRRLLTSVQHHHDGQCALGAGRNIEPVRELRDQFAG
jgi:hypothetical protein